MQYFPPFTFDADQATLWRGADRVRLTPKASALLKCLIAARGSWMSKPDILAAVWPTTHVQADNIKVLVREIRQALGDSPSRPRFVATSPRRGYAFVASVTDGRGGVSGRVDAFVGRDRERAALAEAFDAARTGRPRLVLVTAEHGLGKSALCEAFLCDVREIGPVRSCLGQCFEGESADEPYSPFLDALLRLDRLYPELVQVALARHAPSWLTHFPQWSGTATAVKRHTIVRAGILLDELVAAFEAMSDEVPLVLVIEDLHWADAETLHALSYVAARSRARLLLIATACESDWAAGRRAKQRVMTAHAQTSIVQLAPLTIDHVRQYLDARFGGGGLSFLAAAVHGSTGGMPHLTRIALDRLVSAGIVAMTDGVWRSAVGRESAVRAVREAIADAVSQQLVHLDPRERELLEAAAVAGREFSAAQLAFALAARADDIRPLLSALARRGHLIVAADPVRPGAYRFRQPLYAEVIARRAPMVRQLHTLERLGSRRTFERRRA